jgi:hypothetical protein
MADKARPRRKNAPGAGRPAGPMMPCGWGCGQLMRAGQVRGHFRDCPKRPGRPGATASSGSPHDLGASPHPPAAAMPGVTWSADEPSGPQAVVVPELAPPLGGAAKPSSSELNDDERRERSEQPVGTAAFPEALGVPAGPPREPPAPVAARRVPVPVSADGDPLVAAEEAEVRKALEPYGAAAIAARLLAACRKQDPGCTPAQITEVLQSRHTETLQADHPSSWISLYVPRFFQGGYQPPGDRRRKQTVAELWTLKGRVTPRSWR